MSVCVRWIEGLGSKMVVVSMGEGGAKTQRERRDGTYRCIEYWLAVAGKPTRVLLLLAL